MTDTSDEERRLEDLEGRIEKARREADEALGDEEPDRGGPVSQEEEPGAQAPLG